MGEMTARYLHAMELVGKLKEELRGLRDDETKRARMRETAYIREGGSSPAAEAREKWLKHPRTQKSLEPTTLEAPAKMRPFLQSRLDLAFMAGWEARHTWEKGE